MATGTITLYPNFKLKAVDGTMDLDSHTYKIILMNSSHTFNSAHTQLSDVTANQIATANGYTQNDKALGSITLTNTAGVIKWDAADVAWTATGGSIAANFAVVYNDTTAGDLLVLSMAFDGGEQEAGSGTPFNIIWNANGILTLT